MRYFNNQSYFLAAFLLFAAFISLNCNRTNLIDEEKFVRIYIDLMIYKDTASVSGLNNEELLRAVLTQHKVTFEEYKSTVEYYSQAAERWEKFFTKALAYLESKQKSASKQIYF